MAKLVDALDLGSSEISRESSSLSIRNIYLNYNVIMNQYYRYIFSMSHLSKVKTSLKEISFLKKSLTKLNIPFNVESTLDDLETLSIPQQKSNIEFSWNGHEYELSTDLSFWQQRVPVDEFLNQVTQTYTYFSVLEETEVLGFEKVSADENVILMERWV